jgi:hypothetical protein
VQWTRVGDDSYLIIFLLVIADYELSDYLYVNQECASRERREGGWGEGRERVFSANNIFFLFLIEVKLIGNERRESMRHSDTRL